MIPQIPIESIRPALKEAERFLQWVSERVDIPDQRITITIQTRGKRAVCGWFSANQWSTKEGEPVHELNIAAERLQGDVYDVLETLTHEFVHFWCHFMGVRDCSKSGRHNKTFAEKAEIIGLDVESDGGSKGFAFTSLTDSLRSDIQREFVPDYAAFNLFRVVKPREKTQSRVSKWNCKCDPPVNLRTGKEINVTCNVCGTDFEKVEE